MKTISLSLSPVMASFLHSARQLTIALATAFQEFSKSVKSQKVNNGRKRIAIDLRTPEEMMAAETEETEA